MKKPNYGLDSPSVISTLFIIGAVSLVLAFFSYYLAKAPYGTMFFSYLFVIGCLFWIVIPPIIYSSKIGKPAFIHHFVKSLHLQGHEEVLDIGCGSGLLLNTLAKDLPRGKAIGIDMWQTSNEMGVHSDVTLENARVEGVFDRIELHTGDMRNLPFLDESFDLVFSCLSLHKLPNQDERRHALDEMLRVVKGQGKLILIDFKYINEYANTLMKMGHSRITIYPKSYKMFPPVFVLIAEK